MRELLHLTLALLATTEAALIYRKAPEIDNNCLAFTKYGQAVCCKTTSSCQTGSLNMFGDKCEDPAPDPSIGKYCPADSVYLTPRAPIYTTLGGAYCDAPNKEPWSQYMYSWFCCRCPAGFKSTTLQSNCGAKEKACVGCDGKYERPSWSAATKKWKCSTACYDPPQTCAATQWPGTEQCWLDKKGIDFLKTREGWCTTQYLAGGSPTIGYGHDCAQNKDCDAAHNIVPPLTPCRGDEIFKKDVSSAIAFINKNYKNVGGLNQNQFNALVSITYQCRGHALGLRSRLAAKDYDGMCQDLLDHKYCSGGSNKKRRTLEGKMCREPVDTMSGC